MKATIAYFATVALIAIVASVRRWPLGGAVLVVGVGLYVIDRLVTWDGAA